MAATKVQEEQSSEVVDVEATIAEKKRFRSYLFFFSGQNVSILGSSIVSFVLIWWITETTQSELMLGLASLASLGPFLIAMPFSGVIADRVNRKTLLLVVDGLQALFTVGLTIVFMIFHDPNTDQYTNLLLICVFITLGLRGLMQAFHEPTVFALTPIMIPQKYFSRMNGISYLLRGIIRVIGPALGAILLGVLGVGITLWIDTITFAIAVIPLLLITIPSVVADRDTKERPSFFAQFSEGFHTLKGIKGMIPLLLIATLVNFFLAPLSTLMPLFINKVHSGTERHYALVIGLLQGGMILGALFMTLFKGFRKPVRVAIFAIVFTLVGQSMLILVPTTIASRFWIIGMILFTAIATIPIVDVSFQTSLQLMIAKEKFGRVASVIMFFSAAIAPLGNFLAGLIGEYIPIGIVFTASAVLGIISIGAFYFLSSVRSLDAEIKRIITENGKLAEAKLEAEEAKPAKLEREEVGPVKSIEEVPVAGSPGN